MARYSKRTGPAADFPLPLLDTPIPNLSVVRHFDDGELLVLCHSLFDNQAAGNQLIILTIALDGTTLAPTQTLMLITPGFTGAAFTFTLIPISQGKHTIDALVKTFEAPAVVAIANTAELIVIQLPQWDTNSDIT